MKSEYKYQILGAQNLIKNQLEKKLREEMIGLMWGSTSLNLGQDEYGLVIYKGMKKTVFTFTKDELIKSYGSTEWKRRLLVRINEILRRLEI